jgi:perosamine synthetase
MIPFYKPNLNQAELIAAMVPGSGREAFEKAVAAQMGAAYGLAFAYGRAGLVAIFKALGIQNAEIIITAYTCVVMVQPIVATGNKPVFVDINLTDFNMNCNLLPQAITSQTKAIIATHLYGYPTDTEAIKTAIGARQILLIEDCAQKLGNPLNRPMALKSDLALCSFGLNKELSTIEGGVLVTNSAKLYQKIKAYRDQEMDRFSVTVQRQRWLRLMANYVVFRGSVYRLLHRLKVVGMANRLCENCDFDGTRLPADFATTFMDFQGRIGIAQLKKLNAIVKKRRAMAELYQNELSQIQHCVVLPPILSDANFVYYTLRIPQRDEIYFRQQMESKGIAVDETYEYALPYLKPYRHFANTEYPQAKQAARQVVNLPVYPSLTLTQASYIAKGVKTILINNPPT